MIAFAMNTALAVFWLMLRKEPSVSDFFIGYLLAFFLMIPFKKLLKGEAYVRRVTGFAAFLLLFLKEFIKSNLSVAYIILFVPKQSIRSSFFEFDIKELNLFETILLTYCITLTPGTISVNMDRKRKILIIHCLDFKGPDKTKAALDETFKQKILRFTR